MADGTTNLSAKEHETQSPDVQAEDKQASEVDQRAGTPQRSALEEPTPPPQPPRPLDPQVQAQKTLKEAFPTIDDAVIKAVLSASGGQLEPAFDALLGMTDPDAQKDVHASTTLTRMTQYNDTATSTRQSQLEADEQYARQLHEHYSEGSTQRQNHYSQRQPTQQSRQSVEEDREYSFLDDDLPIIRENIRKGFLETQSTVNKWVSSVRRKLDGDDDDDDDEALTGHPAKPTTDFQARNQVYHTTGRRSGEMGRRSADRDRYDADPQVLGDDFSTLELRDAEVPPTKPQRPAAKPDLFKSGPGSSGRRVSFQDGPPEEIHDPYPEPAKRLQTQSPGGKSSKWQPLSAVDPSPVGETDPFSLGDSDDDKETKPKDSKSTELEQSKTAAHDSLEPSKSDNVKDAGDTSDPADAKI